MVRGVDDEDDGGGVGVVAAPVRTDRCLSAFQGVRDGVKLPWAGEKAYRDPVGGVRRAGGEETGVRTQTLKFRFL